MRRKRVPIAIAIALVVNIVVAGLFIWSRGGQTTTLELQGKDGAYRALLDGTTLVPGVAWEGPSYLPLDAPRAGTVLITIPRPSPSLPAPSGIDSIQITNPNVSDLYFEDKFDSLNLDNWQILSGSFEVKDGVLIATGVNIPNTLLLKRSGWEDYTVKLRLKNMMSGTVAMNVVEGGGVYYQFELVRDFPNFINAVNNGVTTSVPFGGFPHAKQSGTFRSLAAMFTEPYPYILSGLAIGTAIAFLFALPAAMLSRRSPRLRLDRWLGQLGVAAVAVVAAVAFALTYYLNQEYYGGIPHVPDEVAYIFQAQLFAAGRVMGDIPAVKEAFFFYDPTFLYERGDRWASFYPFGHPLILAIGALVGSVYIIPPAVGAALIATVFAIGRRIYDTRTALTAAVLLAVSPFFLMQSSNFMSHSTAALYIMLSLLFILKRERPVLYGLIAGICFGLAFNTRPLSAVALVPTYGILLLTYLRAADTRGSGLRQIGGFVAGGAFMALMFLAYNYGLTGSPTESSYAGNDGATFGFVNGHTFDIGIRNQQAQLMALGLVFNNWPGFAAFALLLLPFLLGTRNRWDYFCLASALLAMGAYTLYRFSGTYEGPRYWYEVAPFLFLIAARGVETAGALLQRLVDELRWRLKMSSRAPLWSALLPIYALLVAFIISGTGGWLLWGNDSWTDYEAHLIPNNADAMGPVFEVDNRLNDLAKRTPLNNALVLVKPCGFFAGVHCYGTVFNRNNLTFDGNVVWARYIPERLEEIIAAYPGRTVYIANWDGKASIEPLQR